MLSEVEEIRTRESQLNESFSHKVNQELQRLTKDSQSDLLWTLVTELASYLQEADVNTIKAAGDPIRALAKVLLSRF